MAVTVGELEVIPVTDGIARLPQEFMVNADWSVHQDLLADDGRLHLPIGCFVVRTGETTVLIDAGFGPHDTGWLVGGELPDQLGKAGVAPGEVDVVVCSHLHLDHAGWLVHDGAPFFPNATVRFGAGDWQQFVTDAEPDDGIRKAVELLHELGRIEPIDDDGESIAPGITARFAPGHTHGHNVFVLSSGDERAVLLGDAITCPIQLQETDWHAVSDVDAALAARTRVALWQELEDSEAKAVGAHFPGLEFGRVLRGEGRRWFA